MPKGIFIRTEQHRKNISLAKIGTPLTDAHKQNISKNRQGKAKGDKNPNWKGGVMSSPYYNAEYQKKYVAIEANYERKLFLNTKRRVNKLGNGGFHTLNEWETLKAQYNWTCPCCKKFEPDIKLTVDHIIPISIGGSDNLQNIQPLCKSCNSKKHDKIIPKYV